MSTFWKKFFEQAYFSIILLYIYYPFSTRASCANNDTKIDRTLFCPIWTKYSYNLYNHLCILIPLEVLSKAQFWRNNWSIKKIIYKNSLFSFKVTKCNQVNKDVYMCNLYNQYSVNINLHKATCMIKWHWDVWLLSRSDHKETLKRLHCIISIYHSFTSNVHSCTMYYY